MQKVAVGLVAGLAVGVALADIGVRYERVDYSTGSGATVNALTLDGEQAINKYFSLTGKLTGERNSDDNTNGFGGAAGVKFNWHPNLYLKTSLGKQFGNAADGYTFYTYGGGVKVPVANRVSFLGDIERTNAFNAGDPHFTTYRVGASFDTFKNQALTVNFVRRIGDVGSKGIEAGYRIGF